MQDIRVFYSLKYEKNECFDILLFIYLVSYFKTFAF